MSADVYLDIPACDSCGRSAATVADMNLTYNLTPMLRGAGMPPWDEFVGMDAHDAAGIWEGVVEELERDPELYDSLNPQNGWGSRLLAVQNLTKFAKQCRDVKKGTISAWL